MANATGKQAQLAALVCAVLAGCASIGPEALQQNRLQYNEIVKTTSEEQLLLNIVRLRYTDTPSSLSVSTIAAQFERSQSLSIVPFFTSAGADSNRSYAAVLPQAGVASADRPTISLTPLDDQEFTRKLFTPLPLDGIIYLAKTTWPISTVFRLYLENLNWVPNAQTASGPTPRIAPDFADFRRGVDALESLQKRGRIVFGVEERNETLAGPLPSSAVAAGDMIEAAKNGYAYRLDEKGAAWILQRKVQQPVLLIDPAAIDSEDMQQVTRTFRLKPGLAKYDITQEALSPFPSTYPAEGVASLDLETRSLLQALYYVSHGIEIPAEHVSRGFVTVTHDDIGRVFDWQQLTAGLFRVRHVQSEQRPPQAHVAVPYLGYWFYIDRTDQDTKATFSLLMELARLELTGKTGPGPVLTLPVGGR